jgi:hypothetical protein
LGSGNGYTFINAGGGGGAANEDYLSFQASGANPNVIVFAQGNSSTSFLVTTPNYRDLSAWYHLVFVYDSANATAANRAMLYINGVQVTVFSTATYPSLNLASKINSAILHRIGCRTYAIDGLYDGLMTEVNFIDGQALTPSSFGQTNASTGVWETIRYTGTYGTNGFYLNFSDNSGTTSTTLGKDSSGNSNNWTPNNFSVTAGAGNDSLVDSPTAYGTDTGVGGTVRGNYATMNPLDRGANLSVVDGNLQVSTTSASWSTIKSTVGITSGKYYWEFYATASNNAMGGIVTAAAGLNSYVGADAYGWSYNEADGKKYTNGAGATYGATYTTNDIIGVAFDADNGTLTFYKNNSTQGTAYTGLTSGPYFPAFAVNNSLGVSIVANFGQRAFAYTAPSGFKALCTTNLPTPTIGASSTTQANDYFNPVLYTGNGTSLSVTGVGFQPDLVWIKSRSDALKHKLTNSVVGVQKALSSDNTDAESTDTGGLTAFNSDGFTIGSTLAYNTNAATYVAWNWNAGGSNATNTSGTITSTVRANTTSGFSIVTYTGNGSSSQTFGHGLGVAPSMVIIKSRNNADNWRVFHSSVSGGNTLTLNTTAAAAAPGFWPSNPSSTVVSIGTDTSVNSNTWTYVAYCFAPVAGYSAFGSYTGNGSADGPFVYTGFRPEYVLVKRTDATEGWYIYDSIRSTYNAVALYLETNTSGAEGTYAAYDFLSNGYKLRGTTFNASGGTYIYAAFAEFPFKYALAR